MSGPALRFGDKTSHGGAVPEVWPATDGGGIKAARVGDKTRCGATLMAGQQATSDLV